MKLEDIKSLSRDEAIDTIIELLDQADSLQQALFDDPDVSYNIHNDIGNVIDELESLK